MDTPQQPPPSSSTPPPASKPPEPPASAIAPVTPTTIQYDDFAKLDLRVATVIECRPHANADKLLVLQVELLGGERRQICAGLRQYYQPDQLVGKQIVMVANLAPRTMRGEVSNGMLLAATDPATKKVIVIAPSEQVSAGSKVN